MPVDTLSQIETEATMPPQAVDSKSMTGQRTRSSFGSFPESLRKATVNAARGTAEEQTAHLRKRLSPQEAARQRAQAASAEAAKKLKAMETENGRMRTELRRAQSELALARQENSLEAGKAAERETGLWNELTEVRSQSAVLLHKVSANRKKWRAVFLSVLMAPVLWATLGHWHASGAQGRVGGEPTGASVPVLSTAPTMINMPGKTVTRDISASADRLDQALGHFGREKAEEVLRRVHNANAAHGVRVCSFEWNGGQASLVFGDEEGLELGTAMSKCADAVEKAAK